jgi:hypothetical protein
MDVGCARFPRAEQAVRPIEADMVLITEYQGVCHAPAGIAILLETLRGLRRRDLEEMLSQKPRTAGTTADLDLELRSLVPTKNRASIAPGP